MDRKCFLLESRGEIVYKADPDLHWTFRNRRKSHKKKQTLCQNPATLVKNLFFDKLEGADFKYGNTFTKLQAKNTQ